MHAEPCIHCGSQSVVLLRGEGRWAYVECTNSDCGHSGLTCDTPQLAVASWNKQNGYPQHDLHLEIQELRSQLDIAHFNSWYDRTDASAMRGPAIVAYAVDRRHDSIADMLPIMFLDKDLADRFADGADLGGEVRKVEICYVKESAPK